MAGGRPAWVPTQEQRLYAETMVAYGIPEDVIAGLMKISPHTLRKHCKGEIKFGAARYIARTAESLTAIAWGQRGNQAISRDGKPVWITDETGARVGPLIVTDWNATRGAAQFILARRGGPEWRETSSLNLNVEPDDNSGAREHLASAIARLAAADGTQAPAGADDAGAS